MNESWDQMLERHDRERTKMLNKIRHEAYRDGLESRTLGDVRTGSMESVSTAVAIGRGIAPSDMFKATRVVQIAHARFEAFHKMSSLKYSLQQIAGFYNMDHTSVLNGIRRHKEINKQQFGTPSSASKQKDNLT